MIRRKKKKIKRGKENVIKRRGDVYGKDRTTRHSNIQHDLKGVPKITITKSLPAATKNRCFIIGGGPSLKGFDFSQLEGEDVIVTNAAISYVKHAKYFVTMDYQILSKISNIFEKAKSKNCETIFVANFAREYMKFQNGHIIDIRNRQAYKQVHLFDHVIRSTGFTHPNKGFGDNWDEFQNGRNSGFCAIQLALLLGYKEVYLLGFDMGITKRATHFHTGYRQTTSRFAKNLQTYLTLFKQTLKRYKGKNRIISCTPNSPLNQFVKHKTALQVLQLNPKPEKIKAEEAVVEKVVEKPKPKPKPKPSANSKELLVIGYYTVNTPYAQEAKKTMQSCDKFGLDYHIVGVPNLGNWQANTRFKAKFVKQMLDEFPNRNLLYVDVDAIFRARPTLFMNDFPYDIGIRYQDFKWRKNECLSGTVFFANNSIVRKIVNEWIAINEKQGSDSKTLEQWNLGNIIDKYEKKGLLRVNKKIPPGYTFIFDIMKRMYPNEKVVIEHFQASRRFRNKVSKKK